MSSSRWEYHCVSGALPASWWWPSARVAYPCPDHLVLRTVVCFLFDPILTERQKAARHLVWKRAACTFGHSPLAPLQRAAPAAHIPGNGSSWLLSPRAGLCAKSKHWVLVAKWTACGSQKSLTSASQSLLTLPAVAFPQESRARWEQDSSLPIGPGDQAGRPLGPVLRSAKAGAMINDLLLRATPIPTLKGGLKMGVEGIPVVAQRKRIRLGIRRLRVRSLASISGLRIWCCCELWCRPAAAAPVRSLERELPYAVGVALKKKAKKNLQSTDNSKMIRMGWV